MDPLRLPLSSLPTHDGGISIHQVDKIMNDLLCALQKAEKDPNYQYIASNRNEIQITLKDDVFKLFSIDGLNSYSISKKLADKTLFALDVGIFGDIFSQLSCACVVTDNIIEIRSNVMDVFITLKVRTFSTDVDIIKGFLDIVNGYGSCALAFVRDTGNYHDLTKQLIKRSENNAIYNVFRLMRNETIDRKFDDVLSKNNVISLTSVM